MKTARTTFFTRDKNFYKTFFRLMLVVAAVQSDQLFKGIPVFLRFRSYKWIHKLT